MRRQLHGDLGPFVTARHLPVDPLALRLPQLHPPFHRRHVFQLGLELATQGSEHDPVVPVRRQSPTVHLPPPIAPGQHRVIHVGWNETKYHQHYPEFPLTGSRPQRLHLQVRIHVPVHSD